MGVLPGDTEPAGVSGHGSDCDVGRRIRLQDSTTLKGLSFAELAPDTTGDAHGHYVERAVSLRDCQLAGELLGLLGILARLLEVFGRTVLTVRHKTRAGLACQFRTDSRGERRGKWNPGV